MSTCVVVGGGVVGLLGARLASGRYDRVMLVERADRWGGLLGSFRRNGAVYDFGTHIPARTGNAALDEILYGNAEQAERGFHAFPYLRSENYFGGRWYPTSPLIDARALPQEQYLQGLPELLQAKGAVPEETNLARHLLATFGDTFTERIYRPVIHKLLGADLENVHRDVLRVFGLQRLIALDPSTTRELKALGRLDASLGFHSYLEGSPSAPYQYPRGDQGIGWWPEQLLADLRSRNVELLDGEEVTRIVHDGGAVKSVELKKAGNVVCDRLIWSIPPVFALRAAGLPLTGAPPTFRTHTLCHFEFGRPLLKSEPQYVLVWEPGLLSYRITLYPSITPDRSALKRFNLTVEVLGDATFADKTANIVEAVRKELVQLGIVDRDNPVLEQFGTYEGPSFPVINDSFLAAAQAQTATLQQLRNLVVLGRGAGATFFINDLLRQAHETLTRA